MFDSNYYHLNYASVKARGIGELTAPSIEGSVALVPDGDFTYFLTVHKNPVRKSGYEDAKVLSTCNDRVINNNPSDARFESSLIRSKSNVIQLVANNQWQYFITLTVSPESDADRFNLAECKAKVLEFMSNYARRSGAETGFKYFLIPEFHKDGAVHFHGVVTGINPDDLKKNDNGYFDFVPYCNRFGFCNMSPIQDINKCASYISKYISKEMFSGLKMPAGTHLYFASRGLKKDRVVVLGTPCVDVKEFIDYTGYDFFECDYTIKVTIDDYETAIGCVIPFEREFKTGVNVPAVTIDEKDKQRLKRRSVNKYCRCEGIEDSYSVEALFGDLMKRFVSVSDSPDTQSSETKYFFALNDYDRLKYERYLVKRREKDLKNGTFFKVDTSNTPLPDEFRSLEMVNDKIVEYESISFIT